MAVNTGPIGGQANSGMSLADQMLAFQQQQEAAGVQQTAAPLAGASADLPVPNIGIANNATVGGFVEQSVIPAMNDAGLDSAGIANQRTEGSFENYGSNKRFAGNDPETGLPVFEDVNKDMYGQAAKPNTLPDTYGMLNDPVKMFGGDEKASLPMTEISNVGSIWANTTKWFYDAVTEKPDSDFSVALGKLAGTDSQSQAQMMEAMGVIGSLAVASTVKAQERYTVGREEMDESESYAPIATEEGAAVQVGLAPDDFMKATGGSVAKMLQMRGIDVSHLTPRDRDALGAKLLEQQLANGNLVETTKNGKVKLTPTEAALMSPLGDMADDLMGTNLKAGVSAIPLNAGTPIGVNKNTAQLSGNNNVTGGVVGNVVNERAKDALGHVAIGIDETALKLIALQIVDLLGKRVTPMNMEGGPESRITYNSSEFAKAYKLDEKSALATYRLKLFDMAENPTPAQQEAVLKDVNQINEQRLTTLISRLNEQLKLTSDGYAGTLNKFYNSYSTGGMNGRMLPNTFNGNYTGDKEVARNVHKAKINPRLSINKSNWTDHNKKVNAAASGLIAVEGDNVAWEKALDSMPESVAAEISFRIVMMGKLLNKDKALHAKLLKDNSGNSLKEGQVLRNLTMGMLYKAYVNMNRQEGDPLYVIRKYADEGKRIKAELDGAPDIVGTLAPLSIEKNATGRQKTKAAVQEWGSYVAPRMDAIAEFTNDRGEMRSDLSLRLNAMKYMEAYNGDSSSNFELDFEVELDSTQSGPLLQSVMAPAGNKFNNVQDRLGFATGTTDGDLRALSRQEFENGHITEQAFKGDPATEDLWKNFMANVFNDPEDGGIAKELILKQPQMQYFYGKPANMFMDLAGQFEANFRDKLNAAMPHRSVADRREDVRKLIQQMLQDDVFDVSYAQSMKSMALMLAATGADLQIQGPHGPIDLTIGSMQHIIDMADNLTGKSDVQALKLQMIDIYNAATDKTTQYAVKERSFNPSTAKPIGYNPNMPIGGKNLRTGPGQKLQDSIGVLLVHHLDAALMNFTISHVNRNQPRHNPYPAKIIYDAIITNASGFLRYSHTYNNVAIPSIRQWDLQKSMGDAVAKSKKKFTAERLANKNGTVPIGVIEGSDGQASPVSYHSAVTGWLDDAVRYMNPKREDAISDADFTQKQKDARRNASIVSHAVKYGYKPPEFSEGYLANGVTEPGEVMILNAGVRTSMRMSMLAYADLLNQIASADNAAGRAASWRSESARKRVGQRQQHVAPKIIANLTM